MSYQYIRDLDNIFHGLWVPICFCRVCAAARMLHAATVTRCKGCTYAECRIVLRDDVLGLTFVTPVDRRTGLRPARAAVAAISLTAHIRPVKYASSCQRHRASLTKQDFHISHVKFKQWMICEPTVRFKIMHSCFGSLDWRCQLQTS